VVVTQDLGKRETRAVDMGRLCKTPYNVTSTISVVPENHHLEKKNVYSKEAERNGIRLLGKRNKLGKTTSFMKHVGVRRHSG